MLNYQDKKINEIRLERLETDNIKISLDYSDNTSRDIILLERVFNFILNTEIRNLDFLTFSELNYHIRFNQYSIDFTTNIDNIIISSKFIRDKFLNKAFLFDYNQDKYLFYNNIEDRYERSPNIKIIISDKIRETLLTKLKDKDNRLFESLRSLSRIIKSYSKGRNDQITLGLFADFKPNDLYFEVINQDNTRLLNGGVILHDNNTYSIHT
jgi:hypothetical protein